MTANRNHALAALALCLVACAGQPEDPATPVMLRLSGVPTGAADVQVLALLDGQPYRRSFAVPTEGSSILLRPLSRAGRLQVAVGVLDAERRLLGGGETTMTLTGEKIDIAVPLSPRERLLPLQVEPDAETGRPVLRPGQVTQVIVLQGDVAVSQATPASTAAGVDVRVLGWGFLSGTKLYVDRQEVQVSGEPSLLELKTKVPAQPGKLGPVAIEVCGGQAGCPAPPTADDLCKSPAELVQEPRIWYHAGQLRVEIQPMKSLAPFSFAYTLAADLDGDCQPDLVGTTQSEYTDMKKKVGVLLGKSGAWRPASYEVAPLRRADSNDYNGLAVGDLNGDSRPDIVVADVTATDLGQAHVLINKGDGTFPAQPTYSFIATNKAIQLGLLAIADLDGDGTGDVVSTDQANHVHLHFDLMGTRLPDGKGSEATKDAGRIAALAVDDLDRTRGADQKLHPDILVMTSDASQAHSLAVLRNPSKSAPPIWRVQPLDGIGKPDAASKNTIVADLDRDGWPDLVIVAFVMGKPRLYVLHNLGAPAWREGVAPTAPMFEVITPPDLQAKPESVTVDLADLDGDGWLDLAAMIGETPYPDLHIDFISLQRGRGLTFDPPVRFGMRPIGDRGFPPLLVRDFTGDRRPDLLMTHGDVYVLPNLSQ